jgi:hypothetical protein
MDHDYGSGRWFIGWPTATESGGRADKHGGASAATQRYIGLPYYGSGSAIPVQFVSIAAKSKHPTPPPVNNNINVNVNANANVNAVAVVNAAAVTNVEAAINASSAIVAAEVIAVLII